jgi:hypothetical protein
MSEPETIALDLTCAECGRSPRAGETNRFTAFSSSKPM